MLLARKKKPEEAPGKNFLVSAFWAFILILLIKWVFPSAIPFGMFEFWTAKAPLWSAIKASWPIFLWASTVTFIFYFLHPNVSYINNGPKESLLDGFVISTVAGSGALMVARSRRFMVLP